MEKAKIHILNVGHGSCSLIEHPSGRLTLIDINNGGELDEESFIEIASNYGLGGTDQMVGRFLSSSRLTLLEGKGYGIKLTNPIEYLTANFAGKEIWRYIQSHPDLDHMRGLVALRKAGYQILNFWDTEHEKEPEFRRDGDEEEWAEYERLRSGKSNRALYLSTGKNGHLWNRDGFGNAPGDGLYVLAPIPQITAAENAKNKPNFNNLSYVLAFTFGGRWVIFGGDAEFDVWEALYRALGKNLKCDVLIASHHGRGTGFHLGAVSAMSPDHTIVSVGEKPETDASDRYRRQSGRIWSTRWYGNITIEIWSTGELIVTPEYQRSTQPRARTFLEMLGS